MKRRFGASECLNSIIERKEKIFESKAKRKRAS